jgi:hypothetical protein
MVPIRSARALAFSSLPFFMREFFSLSRHLMVGVMKGGSLELIEILVEGK